MLKKNPFDIPMCRYGKPTATMAVISEMTKDRVRGHMVYMNDTRESLPTPFNVKHNGRSFAVGSGSGKKRFYFENWDK